MAVIYIPVVAESDYPIFREIGVGGEFPSDFAAFLQRVEQRKTDFHELGYRIREVKVDPAGFKRHIRAGKRATFGHLIRYAARLVGPKRGRKS